MKQKRFYAKLVAVVLLAALLAPAIAVNADEPGWTLLASMSDGRWNFQTQVMDGKIYSVGGIDSYDQPVLSLEVYDPATNTCTTLSPIPTNKTTFETETIDGKLYAIGGNTPSGLSVSSAEMYDPSTDTWTAIASMSLARSEFQTEVIDGKIYAIGGYGAGYLSSAEVYDPNTDTWTTLASMSVGRDSFKAKVIDGKIYAIGGNGSGGELSSVEVYDPGTDAWTTLASMSTVHYRSVTAVIDGKIYVIGGFDTSSAEAYDPGTDTWTTLMPMPIAKSYAGEAVIDGKIYIIGGKNEDGIGELASTEVYDPDTDTWATLSPLLLPRRAMRAEVINGTIYALNGYDDGACIPLIESYTVTSPATPPDAPANLTTTPGDAQVGLSWDAVSGADSYTVMRAAVSGGPYTAIATGLTGTSYTDTDVTNGTTYYYVVVAVNGDGDSDYSNEASATPAASAPTYDALLRITMVTGEIKEYQMDSANIEAFLSWCNNEGAGSPAYMIVKDYNLGPFSAREEHIVYDKISSYEVLEY